MVTLGIYRFWLTTDIRRFLWSNTELAGETLRIHRHRARTPARLPVRHRGAGADLRRRSFCAAPQPRRRRPVVERDRFRAAARARPVRGLSRPALSAHPHGLSRRALPPGRLGLALCGLRDVLVGDDRADARPRLSVRAVEAGALQDAAHFIRRSPGPLRGLGLGAVLARAADVADRDGAVTGRHRLLATGIDGMATAAAAAANGGRQPPPRFSEQIGAANPNQGLRSASASAPWYGRCWRRSCSIRCSRRWCCAGGPPACASATWP